MVALSFIMFITAIKYKLAALLAPPVLRLTLTFCLSYVTFYLNNKKIQHNHERTTPLSQQITARMHLTPGSRDGRMCINNLVKRNDREQ